MKKFIKKTPIIGFLAKKMQQQKKNHSFTGSKDYWIERYESGQTSGAGSYNKLAEFKAEILNNFVKENQILTIIEYGCGDGNQLKLAKYPSYIGFDVSPKAISLCRDMFRGDHTKIFKLMNEYNNETANLTLSLDVIYHLIEDDVFNSYMERLFETSEQFVIIYSSNVDEELNPSSPHVKRRQFTRWVEEHQPNWQLIQSIPNKFPFKGNVNEGSRADFFIYECTTQGKSS